MVAVDDGVRLRTWTAGTAGPLPPVVLLHGGPGMWDYLEPVSRMIEPLTVVHRFDQRGCGGSDPSDEQTMARSVADVEFLRRHFGHDRWIVAGHSFGAELAVEYALAYPERTASLIYLNGVGVGDWRSGYRAESARRMTAAQRDRLDALHALPSRTSDEELEFRTLAWFTDHADQTKGWELARADARVEFPINVEANRRLGNERKARSPLLPEVAGLTMPCHFVHGEGDPRPAWAVADLAAAIPGADLHVLPNVGHEPWREDPQPFETLLRTLIND
jgi:proline iminopeptidase